MNSKKCHHQMAQSIESSVVGAEPTKILSAIESLQPDTANMMDAITRRMWVIF
jgi:hypothetical protein